LVREYVALEKVEGVYALNPLFSTLLVHGDGLQAHIVLIGICDPVQSAALIQRVIGEKVDATDLNKIKSHINDKRVRRQVLRDLKKLSQKAGLTGYVEIIGAGARTGEANRDHARFETIKGVHLEVDPFPEHVLTPTLKVKR
jgi:long-chain acyl-CoA synthetase